MPFLPSLRPAVRQLLRRPGHSLLVVGMLAVAIAGNAAIFGLVHALFLEPLALDEPESLVVIDTSAPQWGRDRVRVSYSDFHAFREHARSFESMALVKPRSFNLAASDGDGDRVERIDGAFVSHDLLDVLRVEPVLGRMFDAAEDRPGAAPVALVSHAAWQRLYGGRADVLGEPLRLDGRAHEIVGVLPRGLGYPPDAEVLVPVAGDAEADYGSYHLDALGRLAPGVEPDEARAELDALMAPLRERWPFKKGTAPVVEPFREEMVGDSATTAWGLQGAVFLVLLIACANVASLMLAHGSGRAREVAVRLALGGHRRSIVGQLLAESLVLAVVGGALGALLARGLQGVLGRAMAEALPFWVTFELRPEAIAISLVACTATVLLFGLGPAWQTTRVDLRASLASGSARAGSDRARSGMLSGLVGAEMALAQWLLVGAGLVVLSQLRVFDVEPGFRTQDMLAFEIALPEAGYAEPGQASRFFDQLRERLDALPGVESATVADHPPLFGHDGFFMEIEGREIRGTEQDGEAHQPVAHMRFVHQDYPETIGLALLHGRFVDIAPIGEDAPREVVVNESFAEQNWQETNVVGRRTRFRGEDNPWLEVVGVAADVRHAGLDQQSEPAIYLPRGMIEKHTMVAVVRTRVEPWSLVPEVRGLVRDLDAGLPVFGITTLEQKLRDSVALRRSNAWLFGAFAVVALLLAAGGTYGVLSYAVHRRRRAIGIHLALGATPAQVWRRVFGRSSVPVLIGSLVGLVGAALTARWLESLLFGVDPFEPGIFLGVVGLLAAVAALANGVPAWRAARLDPMRVLREE